MNTIFRGSINTYIDCFGDRHVVTSRYSVSQTAIDVFATELVRFAIDRLIVQARDEGIRHDLVSATFEVGMDSDLVRLLARVTALQAFVATEDGANLLAGYKRAANILKKEGWETSPSPLRGEGRGEGESAAGAALDDARLPLSQPSPWRGEGSGRSLSYTPEREEADLLAALDAAEGLAESAVAGEDFEGAMAALAGLRAPIDAFFERVTVNDADQDKRQARLAMLARVRDAVHRVADFSRIEG